MDNGKTGEFIKELRKEKGLTQMDLAKRLHITDRAVSKWERGLCAPDIALLEPLGETLEVSPSELIRGERGSEPSADEAREVLDYSKEEVRRKVGGTRRRYLGLLCGVLALVLLVGGALLWRSGVLFLMDKKVSPDGESVVRVYNREWRSWPLRFTTRNALQVVLQDGEAVSYTSYGDWDRRYCTYEGLWWSPDGRRYVLRVRWFGEKTCQWLSRLDLHNEMLLGPTLNIVWYLEEQGLLARGAAEQVGENVEYQFLQWGKDSESMLFYYSFDWDAPYEGYFWYNCETGAVSGLVELSPGRA